MSKETVAEEYGQREHVIFNIVAKKIVETMDDSPPTFVAQTKKHGERQILKEVQLITNELLFTTVIF